MQTEGERDWGEEGKGEGRGGGGGIQRHKDGCTHQLYKGMSA